MMGKAAPAGWHPGAALRRSDGPPPEMRER